HDCQGEHRLARAGFSNTAEDLTGREIESDAVEHARAGPHDRHAEILDGEQRSHGHVRARGSRTSRNPSPRILRPSTTVMIASPGKIVIHGAEAMKSRPLAMILPNEGAGGGGP